MSRHAQHRAAHAARHRSQDGQLARSHRDTASARHVPAARRLVVRRPGRPLTVLLGVGLALAVLVGLFPGGLFSRFAAAGTAEGDVLDTRTAFAAAEDVTVTLASANRGAETSLAVSPANDRTLLKFATAALTEINEATLRVHAAQVDAPVELSVVTAGSGWQEGVVTAADAPAPATDAVRGEKVTVTEAGWVSLPVPTGALAAPQTSLEVVASGDTSVVLTSREGGKGPVLDVAWGGPYRPLPTGTLTVSPSTTTTTTSAPPTSTTTTTRPPTSTTTTTTAPPSSSTTTTTAAPPTGTSPALPFEMVADPGSTKRMAFAHYFTPYPVSIDNKDASADYYTRAYLNPTGENGIHSSYGGLLRDRPLTRPVLGGDWKQTDLETDVRQAKAAGLDGFTVDILNIRGSNWDRVIGLMKAADKVDPDFQIIIQPDMTTLNDESPTAIATAVDQLAAYPAAARLPDGRLIVSPFKAEAFNAAWWGSWLTTMKNTYGENVAFVPTFLDWRKNMDPFNSISYGFSAWGERSPAQVSSLTGAADKAHALGKIWMAPVAVQDVRPNQSTYWEAGNTETLRGSWASAIAGKADWVHIPSWNDYSENTSVAPSANHGWAFLDVSAYWMTQWKKGTAPPVVRDAVYVSSRNQPVAARPSFAQTKLMTLRSNSIPARDTVEALVFLKAASTVTVTVGGTKHTWAAPAGVSAKTFPLGTGTVSAEITRGSTSYGKATLPEPVTSSPYNQDLSYYAASSLRR